MDRSLFVALVLGVLQGIFEWLPISSEGNITILLTAIGTSPGVAVSFALFLHAGTALSATIYYRNELTSALGTLPDWRPTSAFEERTAVISFLGVATAVSGAVGISIYLTLRAFISEFPGGIVVTLVGLLLVVTGLLQRRADRAIVETTRSPSLVDAFLVGGLQGLAILPGVSRSGTTVSVLLLRGYEGPTAFRLSFMLSIPASLGGGLLGLLGQQGASGVGIVAGVTGLLVAALTGFVTIGGLMRLVRRVSFWALCVLLGAVAIAGSVTLYSGWYW
jgi:undecaprenyl-diphosphatase